MDATGDDPRPPSHGRGVRPASSHRDEAGPPGSTREPPWLDLPDERAGRRRGWILAGAALPWILLGVLLVRTPGSANETPESSPVSPSPVAAPAVPVPMATEAPTTAATGARSGLGLADVAATAIPVVRAWLGPADELTIEGIPARAHGKVEHAVVEAIDHPGHGAAVASVLAVVSTLEGNRWEVLRVAVPLRILDREVRPAGEPWLLPAPSLVVAPVEAEPIEDVDSGLVERVGLQLAELYGEVAEVHGLFAGELWPLVADVTIRDPLDGQLRRQQIWIRADQQSLPVAGWFSVPPTAAKAANGSAEGQDPGPTATPTGTTSTDHRSTS